MVLFYNFVGVDLFVVLWVEVSGWFVMFEFEELCVC